MDIIIFIYNIYIYMANLLYNWNFTSDVSSSIVLDNIIYDNQSNLVAKVISRDTITTSTASQDINGITLNNTDSTGGIYIDLLGLDTINLGGDITIEMVIKNTDLTRDVLYFQTIRDISGELNNESAFISCKYKNKTKILVRTDSVSNIGYNFRTASNLTNNINNNDFFHYIFTISHNSNNSSLKIFINGIKKGENTTDLIEKLTDTFRQSNLIGTQKDSLNSIYLKGVVKYLKIYENAMTNTEVETIYNNYNNSPYWSNIDSKSDSEKYTRRHDNIDTYFTDNSSITSFQIQGNQLGLLNNNEIYTIHKFINQEEININDGYHYVPLSGENNFVILKNNTNWYKITQTSVNNGSNTTYKYEISNDNGNNYQTAVTGKTFGDSFTDSGIIIGFGGVESGVSIDSGNICFLGDAIVETDQGNIPIKNITTKNSLFGLKVSALIKVKNIDNYMILFKKNSLGKNSPSIDTFISKNHNIFINNNFVKAISLVNNKDIMIKIRGHDIMYNLLFNKYYTMIINNIIVETLHPKNPYSRK